jgi:hypothetical protein
MVEDNFGGPSDRDVSTVKRDAEEEPICRECETDTS